MVINEEILISAGAELKNYNPGDLIFAEGESPLFYYQIQSGEIKLNNYHDAGKEFIQQILSDGQSIGESLLFTSEKYPMNAIALVSSSILRLPKSSFLSLLDKKKYEKLCNYLSNRLYYNYIMLQNNSDQCPANRLKGIMDYLKSFQKNKNPFSFEIPLTRKQLASLTGLCVETTIRTIKKMEKDCKLKIVNRKILY